MNKEQLQTLLENVAKPISKIEIDLKMPVNTLQKAMSGERELPKKWAIALKHYVAVKQYLITTPEKKYPVHIQNLNEQTNKVKDFSKPPPKTNYTIDTTKKQVEDWDNLSKTEKLKRLRATNQ